MSKRKTKSKSKENKPIKQPLSPLTYALISLIALFIGIGILLLFIFKAEDLVALGIDEKVFYILLFPMGFSAAAFLFGAMRSYARYKGKNFGGLLELGGPVVLFLLVIVLGFYLVPDTKPFDFTIFLRDADGKTVLKNQGILKIQLDNVIKKGNIDEDGIVDFKGIPAKFRNAQVPVELEIDYDWQFTNKKTVTDCILKGNNTTLIIEQNYGVITISGSVIDEDGNLLSGVKVMVKNLIEYTDENGLFTIKIPLERQSRKQFLIVKKKGYESWRSSVYPEIKKGIVIKLNKE